LSWYTVPDSEPTVGVGGIVAGGLLQVLWLLEFAHSEARLSKSPINQAVACEFPADDIELLPVDPGEQVVEVVVAGGGVLVQPLLVVVACGARLPRSGVTAMVGTAREVVTGGVICEVSIPQVEGTQRSSSSSICGIIDLRGLTGTAWRALERRPNKGIMVPPAERVQRDRRSRKQDREALEHPGTGNHKVQA
jgi:hypothetical protein